MIQARRLGDIPGAIGVFFLSLLLGVLAALVGVPVALWNLTNPTPRSEIGQLGVWSMAVLLAVVAFPFLVGLASRRFFDTAGLYGQKCSQRLRSGS